MSTLTETDLKTRRSLLSRLRNLDDGESWRVFFDRYWRMLYNVARRAGLTDADAQDVVQETVVAVARQMPEFRYDRAKGTFKHRLFRIARRRVADHLRRVYRQPPKGELAFDPLAEDDESVSVAVDESAGEFGTAWEQEWQQAVLEAAVSRVHEQVNPKHFQVFDYCVRQGWPPGKVAATLGVNIGQVYLARHRVSRAVRNAARAINEERLRGGVHPG
jgi:RNA polymerase sigma-70 factor (ECF subfamily)